MSGTSRPANSPGLTRTVLVLDPCPGRPGQALKCPGQTPVDTFWGTLDKESATHEVPSVYASQTQTQRGSSPVSLTLRHLTEAPCATVH